MQIIQSCILVYYIYILLSFFTGRAPAKKVDTENHLKKLKTLVSSTNMVKIIATYYAYTKGSCVIGKLPHIYAIVIYQSYYDISHL